MAPADSVALYPRTPPSCGARNHLLVLPSVICATRVAREIAAEVGGVAITHQHGCSQVGDDAARTADAFEALACSPNVGGVVVVSLGCETIQGRTLAERISARGQAVRFVGIQESGDTATARAVGIEAALSLIETSRSTQRVASPLSRLVVGVEISRPSEVARSFLERVLGEGASVVCADDVILAPDVRSVTVPPFAPARHGEPGLTRIAGAGRGARQHVALACAGAQVVVSFPDVDDAPTGFPVCPVLTVAGDGELHRAIAADFDLDETATADELWGRVLDVARGEQTVSERLDSTAFVLDRITRAM
jgi:altronate dehydratase large subunit